MIRRSTLALAVLAAVSFNANAVVEFDQTTTPATATLITGTDIANGGFTTDRANNFEIALRARERYDATDSPTNVTGSNGNGTYNQNAGAPAAFPLRARWNFDFSINSDVADTTGGASSRNLAGFTYLLGMDSDASAGTSFVTFDPINPGLAPCYDHSFGNNGTAGNAGTEVACGAYVGALAANNVAQQSWNYGFFTALLPVDPNADGLYNIFLQVSDTSGVLARSEIQVCVGAVDCPSVPEPASLALLGLGLAGLGFARRRKA